MLAITATFGWHTRHLDIKCAYLNGKLEEELYMKVPPPYEDILCFILTHLDIKYDIL